MKTSSLTYERLIEALAYNPDTGEFVWKKPANGCTKVGATAGSVAKNGYIKISIDGVVHSAHRLAFFFVNQHPVDVSMQVDHINGNRSDNRLSNLRIATARVNQHNHRAANKTPGRTSKHLGVSEDKSSARSPWRAAICVDGNRKRLGSFKTEQEAADAYMKAKAIYHPTAAIVGGAV